MSFCGFTQSTAVAKILKKTKLMVWDEASSTHLHCFECADRRNVDKMRPEVLSQVTWLVRGVFRQAPAVVSKGFRAQIIRAYLRNSPLMWSRSMSVQLTTKLRVKIRAYACQALEASLLHSFAKRLSSIGTGVIRSAVVLQAEK